MSGPLDAVSWAGDGRVAVSVPASNADEALAVWDMGEGVAIPTLQAASFPSPVMLRDEAARCLARVRVLSIALGGGADVSQWRTVLAAAEAGAPHVNQPFTTAAFAKGRFPAAWVNGVVMPARKRGYVQLAGLGEPFPVVDVEVAARMLLEGQVDALKVHPADPEDGFEATVAVARGAARAGMTAFEPAGRIDLSGLPKLVEQLMTIPGLRILPHVFGAVLDEDTRETDLVRLRLLVADLRVAAGS